MVACGNMRAPGILRGMDDASRIAEAIRARLPEIVGSWKSERFAGRVEDEAQAEMVAGVRRLLEAFVEFLASPEPFEEFGRGGATRALVREMSRLQHEAGRDAVGVIEDYATLRRCVWSTVAAETDLSALGGAEVAGFFKKLMQASDWVTEVGLQAYDAIVREEMEQELGRAAATDLVTGLPDREQFNRLLLPRAFATWERFAVAIFDVANFTETVASGEIKRARKVLRRLAKAVSESVPEGAYCARFGDDEVCAIIPREGGEGAYRIAESVLESIAGQGFEVDVGVAGYPEHGADAGELMGEALKALKMAKRVGGSGIVVAR